MSTSDLTALYYTADAIPSKFAQATMEQLKKALGDIPLIIVRKPAEIPRGQAQIYRQVLEGAKQAQTRYVACCEDDCLYSPEHFKFRPKDGHWGYNMNSWSLFTWNKDFLSQKRGGRKNLSGLICERQLLIDHLEERFQLWPDDSKVDIRIFGEPGKYDNQLGTTPYPIEEFHCNPPNIVFSHENNLQFAGLGTRKRVGEIRATSVPYWGHISDIIKLYNYEYEKN